MLIEILKSKIHRVRLTDTNLNYQGSIALDERLIKAANLITGEKVQVLNVNNGQRITTYVIPSSVKGEVSLHGPASRTAEKGDLLIVISYGLMTPEEAISFVPSIIHPDETTNLLT